MTTARTTTYSKSEQVSMGQKVGVVLWFLLLVISLGVFVGGIYNASQPNQFGQTNCLLYANTASRYNQQIPFGGGQSFPNQFGMNQGWGSNPWDMSNPSACQSVLIQGIAALILAIIVGLIACYIVFTNSPTRPMAGGLSFLTALLTILLVAMTANVMAGLIYTCAPFGTVPGGSFCTPTFSFAFFTTTSVGTVQTAIVFGWIASACMLFLALLAAYWVGISFRRLTFFTTTETEKY